MPTTAATVKTVDVQVSNQGSLFTFTLLTPDAHEWVESHVEIEGYMWMGRNTFCCEHRYAEDIAEGMRNDDLVVE